MEFNESFVLVSNYQQLLEAVYRKVFQVKIIDYVRMLRYKLFEEN